MSQITRCPHCATAFRVVPDQLRLADGWVRCGQCKEVFDARQSLQDPQVPAAVAHTPTPPAAPSPSESSPTPPVRTTPPQAEVWRSARNTPAGRPTHATAPALPWFLLAQDRGADQPQKEPEQGAALRHAWHGLEDADGEPEPQDLHQGETGSLPYAMPAVEGPDDLVALETDRHDSSPDGGNAPPAPLSLTAAEAYADTHPAEEFEPPVPDPQPTTPVLDLELPPAPGLRPGVETDTQTQAGWTPHAMPELDLPDRSDPQPWAAAEQTPAEHKDPVQDADLQQAGQLLSPAPVAPPFLRPARNPVPWPDARAAMPDAESPVNAVAAGSAAEASQRPPETPEPHFVRLARRSEFWQQPAVRGLLALSGAALALLLILQLALQQRDALGARQPGLRPLLQLLCVLPGCTLAPPREPGSVVIDSSSFTRTAAPADGFTLRFALKNNAGHGVAMPLIELTLTDSQDQPVLRRVLQPAAELGAPRELAAGAVWSGATGVRLAEDTPEIAGYRLLAFYP